jgi:hypothetical protein
MASARRVNTQTPDAVPPVPPIEDTAGDPATAGA